MYVIWLIRDVRGWVSSWTVSGKLTLIEKRKEKESKKEKRQKDKTNNKYEDSENNNFFNEWSINDYNLWGFYSGCDDGLSLLNTTDPTLLPKIKGNK